MHIFPGRAYFVPGYFFQNRFNSGYGDKQEIGYRWLIKSRNTCGVTLPSQVFLIMLCDIRNAMCSDRFQTSRRILMLKTFVRLSIWI